MSENKNIPELELSKNDYVISFDLYSSKAREEVKSFIRKIHTHNNPYASSLKFSIRTDDDKGINRYVAFVMVNVNGNRFDAAKRIISFLCEKIAITKNI